VAAAGQVARVAMARLQGVKQRNNRRAIPTSRDVAALAGVSQSTVSYVMSGKRAISEETRRRVQAAIEQLTYQPHAGARALRGRRTNVIALVVRMRESLDPAGTIPYVETIVETARARDYDVVLVTTDEGPEGLTRLAKRRVCDAFVLMDIRKDDDRIETAAGLELPVVLMGIPEDRHGLDAVDFNTRRAAELLVDELADTGHRHIVLVGAGPNTPPRDFHFISEFYDGARQRAVLRELDFVVVEREEEGWTGIERAADRLLARRADRLGWIARTPQVTDWLLQLARLKGLIPGRDLSIVSLCTKTTATALTPPVTNVSPEPRDLARLAMTVLFELLDGAEPSGSVRLVEPAALERRETTALFS
jgi:DNA-binding LacI/PurR family transcriptional regulator